MRDRPRHRQREKQAPCREPDVGLNPKTLGSHPEPKADAQPLSHPDIPRKNISYYFVEAFIVVFFKLDLVLEGCTLLRGWQLLDQCV